MIRLEVQPYCQDCLGFESSVTSPMRIPGVDDPTALTDTIIQCKWAKRCANIQKYLERKMKNGQ